MREFSGFRPQGRHAGPECRKAFWEAVRSGLTPSAAATAAGVSLQTGHKWAKHAGHVTDKKAYGIRYPAVVKEVFWAQLRAGASVLDAAVHAGVPETTAKRWARAGGHVPRSQPGDQPVSGLDGPRGRLLSYLERCRLEELQTSGRSVDSAAQLLGRDRATIYREIARGKTVDGYRAWVAQEVCDAKRKRPKTRKLDNTPALLAEVVSRLEKRDSPEQIAGRLRLDFPEDPEMWVSHETIYQALYVQPRGELAKIIKTALRTGRIKRKPQGRASANGSGRLKDMVNISERPAEAADRAVPGHWEGDLILGSTASNSAIGTLVERTTGFVVLLHLRGDRKAETLAAAMTAKIPEIPQILLRSLTWDQGKEMALHTKITEATGLPIYFADPHSPWQRGTNENTNGLLRQYFPKGTDLSFYGPGWLDQVASELNARPRKRLGFRTPAEELDRLLSDPDTFVAATA